MTAPNSRERILPRLIEEEMQQSFINYSMSVIVSRALPDGRQAYRHLTPEAGLVPPPEIGDRGCRVSHGVLGLRALVDGRTSPALPARRESWHGGRRSRAATQALMRVLEDIGKTRPFSPFRRSSSPFPVQTQSAGMVTASRSAWPPTTCGSSRRQVTDRRSPATIRSCCIKVWFPPPATSMARGSRAYETGRAKSSCEPGPIEAESAAIADRDHGIPAR
jgi:hypothetical protein